MRPALKFSATFLLVLGVFFWSGNYVLGRAVVATVPPLTLTYVRWLLVVLIFYPFCRRELAEHRAQIKKIWPVFLLLGFTGLIGFNFFQYESVKYTTAINATIINASTPMFTAFFSYLIFRERLTAGQAAGIACSFLGVLYVISEGHLANLALLTMNKGDLFMLGAVLLNTFYYFTLKRKGYFVPQKTLFFLSALGGLAVTLPVPFLENLAVGTAWVANLRPGHFASLLYFAIFPSILSIIFLNRAIVELGPVKTSIFQNLSIVFSSFLGILFLGEQLQMMHVIGSGLIVFGIWLMTAAQTAKPTASGNNAVRGVK